MYSTNKKIQAQMSKEFIVTAFLTLARQFPYEQITITQICQYAGVSRPTFYRNFEYKSDVLAYYLSGIPGKLALGGKTMRAVLQHFYCVMAEYQEILCFIDHNHLDYILKAAVRESLDHTEILSMVQLPKSSEDYSDFVFDFVSSTICSVLSLWVKHDLRESPEMLTHLTETFLGCIVKSF